MPAIIYYIIKLSIALCVVYLFYQLVLRKLTFYNWNRWYLLVYSMLAFFIPFINISPVINNSELQSNTLINWIPVLEGKAMETTTVAAEQGPDGWKLVFLFIAAGSLVLAGRLLLQFFSFSLLLQRAELIEKGTLNLYHVDDKIIPFSFGNSIFINRNQHSADELQEIIAHEFVHVRQRHTMDIIWGEILFMLNWYNPFAWLIRKAIRQNLEFIADNQVISSGMDKKQYQYLLLKVIGNNHFSIAQHFNFSSLKKRIAMMNKLRSAKHNLARFLFLLPLLAVMLISFRSVMKNKVQPITKETYQQVIPLASIDTTPVVGITAPPVPAKTKLPENVQRIAVKNDEATVWLKDGKKESYDLSDAKEKKEFEKKYGKIPPPPPPVPPAPAVPPVPPAPPVKEVATIATGKAYPDISKFNITDKEAVVHKKDGTVERYDLTDKEAKKKFEERYGKTYSVTTVETRPVVAVKPDVYITEADVASTVVTTVKPAIAVTPTVYSTVADKAVAAAVIPAISSKVDVAAVVVEDDGEIVGGVEDILISITKNTTRDELNKLVEKVKSQGYTLEYDEIEYNDNGKLVNISGMVTSKISRNKFVANDFEKLTVSVIKKDGKSFFRISIKDNKTAL